MQSQAAHLVGPGRVSRAQGCLLGQLIGDALGSQVEFKSAWEIAQKYPDGVRDMRDGGTWNTLAGQPTDDSEMALLLARLLAADSQYSSLAALKRYQYWLDSGPFDVGGTIGPALHGRMNNASQANGAMMRVSPLGIFGAGRNRQEVMKWARMDAELTHPNRACLEINALFAAAIAEAVDQGSRPEELYRNVLTWIKENDYSDDVRLWTEQAANSLPESFEQNAGWVKIAWSNALYQLLHAPNFEEALVATVGFGGDTDTNAAIVGALLGAVHGREAIPFSWVRTVLGCRPAAGTAGVRRPRPETFWPVNALELATTLLTAEESTT